MNVSEDGTRVVTESRTRSKSTCDCRAKGIAKCNHGRIFSLPNCNSGWDISREKFFSGNHPYMINACDSPYDLSLYPRLNPATNHDSISFVVSWTEFSQRFNHGALEKILLDAAHDAYSIYELINHGNAEPIIDLNRRAKKDVKTDGDIKISLQDLPICPIGKEISQTDMTRQKWRCQLACGIKNSCETPCSTT